MSFPKLPRPRQHAIGGRHGRNDGLVARLDVSKGHTMRHAPPGPPAGLR
jgi:hypothetical protein